MKVRHPQTAGLISMMAALLVPSWWVLPQVLAGLGAVSIVSTGCLLWLERLQPLFALVAATSLLYQGWLVWRRPPQRRTRPLMAILLSSIAVCGVGLSIWIALSLRYR